MLIVGLILAFKYAMIDPRNCGVGTRGILVNLRNDGEGF